MPPPGPVATAGPAVTCARRLSRLAMRARRNRGLRGAKVRFKSRAEVSAGCDMELGRVPSPLPHRTATVAGAAQKWKGHAAARVLGRFAAANKLDYWDPSGGKPPSPGHGKPGPGSRRWKPGFLRYSPVITSLSLLCYFSDPPVLVLAVGLLGVCGRGGHTVRIPTTSSPPVSATPTTTLLCSEAHVSRHKNRHRLELRPLWAPPLDTGGA